MKLTAKSDLDTPVGFVFETLTDFPHWEREGVRRGIDIERAPGPVAGVGAGWKISGRYRGKQRKLQLRIVRLVPDQQIEYAIDSPSVEGSVVLETTALSARRSRVRMVIDVKPKTLAARLFLNTLRLAKGRVESRLDSRLEKLGVYVKLRHERSQAQA